MPKGKTKNPRSGSDHLTSPGRPRKSNRAVQSAVVIARRRDEIARMYLLRKTQTEIAQTLGVSQPLVAMDLKAIREAWLQSALRNFDEAKAQALAEIDDTERIAMEQFEISKRPERFASKRVKRRRNKDEDGDGVEVGLGAVRGVEESTSKGRTRFKHKMTGPQIVAKMRRAEDEMVVVEENTERTRRGRGEGNPDWLRVRQWCINQRCLILGLLKPPDVTVNNNLGVNWDSIHAPVAKGDPVEERIQEAEVLAIEGAKDAPTN